MLTQAVAGLRFAGLMERCWDSESTLRPSASELVDELEVYVYLYVYLYTSTCIRVLIYICACVVDVHICL